MSGNGLKALPKSESGQKTLANVREWSKGYLECPRGPLRCPGVAGSPSQMSGSDREALPNVRKWREALPDVREWLGCPPKCPRVVGMPFRMSGEVGRPFQMSGSGWEALLDVWKWLGGPPGRPEVGCWPSRRFWSGR